MRQYIDVSADEFDRPTDFPAIRDRLHTLQMNLGYLCNLAWTHCHVEAGPRRTELMDVDFTDAPIAVGDHCYGCTAGQGSSCGGALS